MSIIQASFPENIYFSSQKNHTELCDFVFSIHINANLKDEKDKDQSEENSPIVYIGGLSKLFPKVEENPENKKSDSSLKNFIRDLRVIGNDNNWSIKYNDKYDLLKLKCKTEHSFTDKYTVGFELSQECEFSKELENNEPIPLDVTFINFDSIFDGLANETVASYTIYAKEVPYVEEFYACLGSEGKKVKTVPKGEWVKITWSVRNAPKASAFLCDESGTVICNKEEKPVMSPYNVQINEDRRFKLFVEKDGRTISQTLSIKAAYVIKNTDDWNAFATTVDNGDTYLDKLVILDKEITVSQKIGDLNRGCFFSGTFDGNGNTITANIKDESKSGMSLFHIIQNATIKNLTVKGSITGGIHSAGLVGYSRGAGNKILNCIVEATINGGSHIGGILGHGMSSDIGINNCVFKGNLLGGSEATGVFVGWSDDGGAKSVTNCLYIMQKDQKTENLDLVKMLNGSVCVGNCYKTENIGTYGTRAYLTEQPNFSTIEKTAVDGTKFYVPVLPSGCGTEKDPYIINNEKEWNSFAKSVSDGKTYAGEFIKLNEDISVSQRIGEIYGGKFFAGTFDGNRHTITANIKVVYSGLAFGPALFDYIQSATIKNLTVAGMIYGKICPAGLVAHSYGAGNKILNCIVEATIIGILGINGILGLGKDGDTTIDNCVFKGRLDYDHNYKKFLLLYNVFVGLSGIGNNMVSIKNCLYIKQNDQDLNRLDLVHNKSGSIIFTDCYKTVDIGKYGTLVYLEKPSSGNYIEKTAVDGTIFYVPT